MTARTFALSFRNQAIQLAVIEIALDLGIPSREVTAIEPSAKLGFLLRRQRYHLLLNRFDLRFNVFLVSHLVYLRCHTTSNSPAAPMPPPMHMVTTTCLAPRRLPSINACPTNRAPETP